MVKDLIKGVDIHPAIISAESIVFYSLERSFKHTGASGELVRYNAFFPVLHEDLERVVLFGRQVVLAVVLTGGIYSRPIRELQRLARAAQ